MRSSGPAPPLSKRVIRNRLLDKFGNGPVKSAIGWTYAQDATGTLVGHAWHSRHCACTWDTADTLHTVDTLVTLCTLSHCMANSGVPKGGGFGCSNIPLSVQLISYSLLV